MDGVYRLFSDTKHHVLSYFFFALLFSYGALVILLWENIFVTRGSLGRQLFTTSRTQVVLLIYVHTANAVAILRFIFMHQISTVGSRVSPHKSFWVLYISRMCCWEQCYTKKAIKPSVMPFLRGLFPEFAKFLAAVRDDRCLSSNDSLLQGTFLTYMKHYLLN